MTQIVDSFNLSFSPQVTQRMISTSTVKERVIVFIYGTPRWGTESDKKCREYSLGAERKLIVYVLQ